MAALSACEKSPMRRTASLVFAALLLLSGCQSTYYAAMEKVGVHKRDILVDRVEEARDAQLDAKEQFRDALERYRSVVQVNGGELEARYDALNSEYLASEESAKAVRQRIKAVEDVAEALFDEWEAELAQYSNASLRSTSARELARTRQDYRTLIQRMQAAERRIEPVLSVLRDQVLFLKHNLNAQAIASLQSELGRVEGDVSSLIREMEAAIREADAFIGRMEE